MPSIFPYVNVYIGIVTTPKQYVPHFVHLNTEDVKICIKIFWSSFMSEPGFSMFNVETVYMERKFAGRIWKLFFCYSYFENYQKLFKT